MDLRGKAPACRGRFDVIVTGGGIAGIAAAVSAARKGARTLLIEKTVNLGGLATTGLISWYEPLCDGKGKQVVGGIAEELIQLAISPGLDDLAEKWGGSRNSTGGNERYATHFSPGIFSLLLDEYVVKNKVKLCFDTLATYPVMDGTRCLGVVVESCSGKEYFEAGAVVDATGDACVMERAGVPTVTGKNYLTYTAHGYDREQGKKLEENTNLISLRKWISAGADLNGNGHPQGLGLFSGETAEERTKYMLIGKQMLLDRIREKKKGSMDLMAIPGMPQLRKIRRIQGKADFCAINGEYYEDTVGSCGDFRPKGIGNHYHIPFGSLYHPDFENMIAAGRIISAPDGDGWEVARVIPVCALTGEIAGKAAALCCAGHVSMEYIGEHYINCVAVAPPVAADT